MSNTHREKRIVRGMLPLLALALLAGGCVKRSAQVDQAYARLDFSYQATGAAGDLKGKSIGILAPTLETGERAAGGGLMRLNRPQGFDWKPMMAQAFQRDLEQMLTRRGAAVLGPYGGYDEVPFGEKERMLMVLEPRFEVRLLDRVESEEASTMGNAHLRKGRYVASASGVLKFREPLTNEVIYVKRVRVNVESEPYEYAFKFETSGNLIYDALANGMTSEKFEEHDTRPKRRNEALNALYRRLMARVDAAMDAREMSAHVDEIRRLKHLKRY